MTKENLLQDNYNEIQEEEDLKVILKYCKKEYAKNYFSILLEWLLLKHGRGKLTLREYLNYSLFNDKKYTFKQKKAFISNKLNLKLEEKCCNQKFRRLTENKHRCNEFLLSKKIPISTTQAIFTGNNYFHETETKTYTDIEEFKNFLLKKAIFPLFAKPNLGMGSMGAFVIEKANSERLTLSNNQEISYDTLYNDYFCKNVYLLQSFVKNHKDLKKFSTYVPTIRTGNVVTNEDSSLFFALIKIPSNNNVADNYWRKGNIIADIDIKDGTIKRALTGKGANLKEVQIHPDTNEKIIDFKIPYWDDILNLNQRCSHLFKSLKYHTFDIAITDDGPIVIEVNAGGDFFLPQLVSGKGLINDEFSMLLKKYGF